MDKAKQYKFNLEQDGLTVLRSEELLESTNFLREHFESQYRSRFTDDISKNRNLIKRFTQDPVTARLFSSETLINLVKNSAFIDFPVQTGPIVSHYTANDVTGDGFGLDLHQDWPSMATSSRGVVCWITLYDTYNSHSLLCVPGSHSLRPAPGQQTADGYIVEDDFSEKHILQVSAGCVVLFSPWLVHGTYVSSNSPSSESKLALSTRFDDLNCEDWNSRAFVSAYGTTVDRELWKSRS